MAHRGRSVPTLVALVVLGSVVALRLATGSRAAFSTTLDAYVTQDGFIGIDFADGTPIGKALPAGTCTVNVDDSTDIHQFHLFGPGVDRETDVDRVEKQTWTVTFQAGANYSYQCDLLAVDDESKHGGFTVQRLRTAAVTVTSASFVGSRDMTIALAPGQWFFFTPAGKKSYFIVTR